MFVGARGVALAAPLRARELAARFGGEVDAAAREALVERVAAPGDADAACVTPLYAARSVEAARVTAAALVLVDAPLAERAPLGRRWVHPSAHAALVALLEEARDARLAAAVVDAGAVHPSARVGPGAVIEPGARVGAGSVVGANAVVHAGVVIGERAVIGAGSVLGAPGFGFVERAGMAVRVPHLAGVLVGDDAELGALCTIDAGVLAPTVIERGVKLDAHVHVGHGATIGEGSMVAAQSGLAGSVRLGRGVLVGGQAGFVDHVRVGDGARVGAKSAVIGDVAAGATVAGVPAIDKARWLRATAHALRAAAPRRGR